MTRDEAIKEFWQISRNGHSGVFERAFSSNYKNIIKKPIICSEFDKFIDKIFDGIENRKCDGCKWEEEKDKLNEYYLLPEYCRSCVRAASDRFEPKE